MMMKAGNWKRISLAAMLIAVSMFAGFFAGFRYGTQTADAELVESRAMEIYKNRSKLGFPKPYPIFDLIPEDETVDGPAAQQIVSALKQVIGPDRLVIPASGHFGGRSKLVVLEATSRDHEKIAAYLTGLRTGVRKSHIRYASS